MAIPFICFNMVAHAVRTEKPPKVFTQMEVVWRIWAEVCYRDKVEKAIALTQEK